MARNGCCSGHGSRRAALTFRSRGYGLAVSLGLLAVSWCRFLRAEPLNVWIEVFRAPESLQCPDASVIVTAAAALFPQKQLMLAADRGQASLSVDVTIHRTFEGHEGLVVVRGAHSGQRRIVDSDEECRGLAHALAVALVLSIDPNETYPADSYRTLQPSGPTTSPVIQHGRTLQIDMEAGALTTMGLLGGSPGNPSSFGGYVGIGLSQLAGPGFRVRGVGLQSLLTEQGTRYVRVDLLAGVVASCWRLGSHEKWNVDPCWDLGIGRQHGEGIGYAPYAGTNTQSRLWLATGPSLTFSYALIGILKATATAGMLARLYRQPFSIMEGNHSTAVQTQEPVGEYLGFGLTAVWPSAAELSAR